MTYPVNIPITDDFVETTYANYYTYNAGLLDQFANQNHVDIRTFNPTSETTAPESWVISGTGTITSLGAQSDINYWNGIEVACTTGTITLTSSPLWPIFPTFSEPTTARSVDLLTGFEDTDFLSLGLPSFPLSDITTASSYIELIDFNNNSVKVYFNQSILTLTNGNSEFRVERSAIDNDVIDLADIVTVQIVIVATSSCTFRAQAFRLIGAEWQQGPVDFDNWFGRLRSTPTTNGADTPSTGYTVGVSTFTQPILLRSNDPSNFNDPTPIDVQLGVVFNTGLQNALNTFNLYMREYDQGTPYTQNDLNYLEQYQLDGLPQPNINTSIPSNNWIIFSFQWGTSFQLSIGNQLSFPYIFNDFSLSNNTYYILICSLQNTTAQAYIYPLNGDFSINPNSTLNTTAINDEFTFPRRAGRVGWNANLLDGSTFVSNIRQRELTFAEYISTPLNSYTPVSGGQIFANSTPNIELWEEFLPGPNNLVAGSSYSILYPSLDLYPGDIYPEGSSSSGGSIGSFITRDSNRSITGLSYRIQIYGTSTNQGFISNALNITDLSQIGISFSIWYPSNGGTLVADLISEDGFVISLSLPEITPNQWQNITINAPSQLASTGYFFLYIYQPQALSGTWWIDNVSVFQRAVLWSGRSVVDDPWESNYAPWTDFQEGINSYQSGAQFPVWGSQFQVKAKGFRQDSYILGPVNLLPKYAQLGRLIWPENNLTGITGPTASFTYANPSLTVTLTNTSTAGTANIILYEWNLGDGSLYVGKSVPAHTYAATGTYNITLTVTDAYAQRSTTSQTVAVS
jgi:hypothetical protein